MRGVTFSSACNLMNLSTGQLANVAGEPWLSDLAFFTPAHIAVAL